MKMKKSIVILSGILALAIITLILFNYLQPPINLELFLSPIETLNKTGFAELTLTVESRNDMQGASGEITLPEGFELVEGSLEWETDLEKNKPETFKVIVKSVKGGEGVIKASVDNADVSVELATEISPSGEGYISEEEFYKNRKRSYVVGLPGGSFVPEPRKGKELNDYFKSLNLTEDYIYAMMQFEALGGDPTHEQMQTLANDGITLFEYHGDHTYYAKIPKTVLETKSYDFVRWIGIVEDSGMKLVSFLKERIWDKNCIGRINLSIIFYQCIEDISDFQIKLNQIDHIINISENLLRYGDDSITMNVNINNLEEIAPLNFVKKIEGMAMGSLEWEPLPDPFSNITCTS